MDSISVNRRSFLNGHYVDTIESLQERKSTLPTFLIGVEKDAPHLAFCDCEKHRGERPNAGPQHDGRLPVELALFHPK
jgi:hypothetical protein